MHNGHSLYRLLENIMSNTLPHKFSLNYVLAIDRYICNLPCPVERQTILNKCHYYPM